ncbi:MAG: T9SS type A sorting domain-containing protein [Niastella sp.]|nr:T9SS type A sorting domain-containing protein [Niastella sp.]
MRTPVMAVGTAQVMPNPANGAAILIAPTVLSGPYREAPAQNRISFVVADHEGENFYFNVKAYDRTLGIANQVAVYYRIMDALDNMIVGATPISPGQQISTYNQAVAGPNIDGTAPTGFVPLVFNPSANGTYYIEIYFSTDAGLTVNTAQTLLTLFEFTIATPAGVRRSGRIYSQAWSFITYNPTGNQGNINNSFAGDFYAYTNDSTVAKLGFTGFRPLGFTLCMNNYGAVNGTNWFNDRRSQNTGAVTPSLPNGYPVFLDIPDATIFPTSTPAVTPQFTGTMYGCAPDINIPYWIDRPGDVVILLDLNGVSGYQAGTADRYLYFIDRPAGHNVGVWDGLNGLGATVVANATIDMMLSIRRGRVNIPLYDAELNPQGFNVAGIMPLSTVPRLYFDDGLLTNTIPATCANSTTDVNNNNTGAGITNVNVGLASPARAWNGPGSGNAVPAPAAGGSGTAIACDDFGNARTLNTWFWTYEVNSAIFTMIRTGCSSEEDALPITLVQFNAERIEGSKVNLMWRGENQSNFEKFVLERSEDGINFKAVATIPGKEGMQADYNYLDAPGAITGSKLYYRLKQVDKDARFKYSRILSVSFDVNGLTVLLRPNPASNFINISINSDKKLSVTIKVVDNFGGLLLMQRGDINKGDNIVHINNVSLLKNGIYSVVVIAGHTQVMQKLIIQK